ncbi:MAG: YcgJ family protein [Plesiomonas sp.]|uniref:YcgJ family protein n=1 Tax=Plesiomonas sp. TaxID=2486279 RepID=UPI003F3BA5CF
MNPFTVLIIIAIGVGAFYELVQQVTPDIFIPEQGVVCDRIAKFCATKSGISLLHSLHYINSTLYLDGAHLNNTVNKDRLSHIMGEMLTDTTHIDAINSQTSDIVIEVTEKPARNIQFSHGIYCNLDTQHCSPVSDRATYIEVNLFSMGD